MASIKSLTRSSLFLLLTTLPAAVDGCSCGPKGETPSEEAAFIKGGEYGSDLVYVIATFTNATSYSIIDDYKADDEWVEPYELTFQNTTFNVKEILVSNNDPSVLPSGITVQADGTMVYETSTETTCCLCGRTFSAKDIGKDLLLPIASWGLNICDSTCFIENEWCSDVVNELRGWEEVEVQPVSTTAEEPLTADAISTTEFTSTSTSTVAATTDAPATTEEDPSDATTTTITTVVTTTVAPATTEKDSSDTTPATMTVVTTVAPPTIGKEPSGEEAEEEDPVDDVLASQEPSPGSKKMMTATMVTSLMWVSVFIL